MRIMKIYILTFFLLINMYSTLYSLDITKLFNENVYENNNIVYEEAEKLFRNYDKTKNIVDLYSSIILDPRGYKYYELGDYLFELEQYDNAIKSYEIAIKLNFDKKYYAYYNISCAYSLQHKLEMCYQYLEIALKNGYPHFDFILKDTDLLNLKNDDLYEILLYTLVQEYRESKYETPKNIATRLEETNTSYSDFINSNQQWKIFLEEMEEYNIISLISTAGIDWKTVGILIFKNDKLAFAITSNPISSKSIKYYSEISDSYFVSKFTEENNNQAVIDRGIALFSFSP